MRHIRLILEYDGTSYSGWQSQRNGLAIQDVVSSAIEKMTEEKPGLRGASRTDAGVHARGQVASFRTSRSIPCEGFLKGLNSLLPEDIRVSACEEVGADFHPVDSAKRKIYEYLLETGGVASPLLRNRVWWVGSRLDVEVMQEAAAYLVGLHDFKSFQGPNSSTKTTVRRVDSVVVSRQSSVVRLEFTATGFLKYMVRNIVGTLVEAGQGRLEPADVEKILAAKDRTKAGRRAPPQGLYLVRVEYF